MPIEPHHAVRGIDRASQTAAAIRVTGNHHRTGSAKHGVVSHRGLGPGVHLFYRDLGKPGRLRSLDRHHRGARGNRKQRGEAEHHAPRRPARERVRLAAGAGTQQRRTLRHDARGVTDMQVLRLDKVSFLLKCEIESEV